MLLHKHVRIARDGACIFAANFVTERLESVRDDSSRIVASEHGSFRAPINLNSLNVVILAL